MEEEKKPAAAVEWEESPQKPARKRTRKKAASGTAKTAKTSKKKAADKTPPTDTPEKPAEETQAAPAAPAQAAGDSTPVPAAETEPPETTAEAPAQPEPAEHAEPAETAAAETAEAASEPPAPAEPADAEPEPKSDTSADPAVLTEYEFSANADAETDAADSETDSEPSDEEKARAATISRTAQLSIAQIMAGLDENPAPPAEDAPPQPEPAVPAPDSGDDEPDDEPEDTISQKLGRGAFGMVKWLLLVVLFVLIIAGGGVAWLYRSATPDMLPEISVTFDGQALTPSAYSWHVPVVGNWFKRTYAETISSAPLELETPVSGASPDIVISPSSYISQLTITNAANESVYDGTATGFRSYRFTENGTYDARLVLKADSSAADGSSGVTGTETWQFRFTVSIKPSIQLCTDTVQQGSVAAVRVGTTLGTEAPTIKTSLKNVGFVRASNGWICYLPIPWNEQTGSVDLTVTADGYTETLTLSVRAASYAYKDYSRTSQMVSPYIGEDDAPAAVSKLFSVVDDDIQWSVGGFVQPFLDSFDTTLSYGMTEYAGRAYSERSTNYGYGGRTSTNVVIAPKNRRDSMIAPASGRVLLAEDLGDVYGGTIVIEHGAGLKSIFYGLSSLDVKTGDLVKQGQLLGASGKTVVAEMRLGTVPIDPLLVWRSQCEGLKNY